jgi:hypothetical protein
MPISIPDLPNDTLQAAGLNLIQDYENGSFLIVEPHSGSVTAETVDALMADNAVTYAAPDYIMSASSFNQEPWSRIREGAPMIRISTDYGVCRTAVRPKSGP